MRCSAYATGHHVLTGRSAVQHRGGERLVRLEANQREQRELEGFAPPVRLAMVRRPGFIPATGAVRAYSRGELSDRRCRSGCAHHAQRFRCAPAHERRRVGEERASARLPPMRRRSGPVRTRPSRARPGRGRQASPKALAIPSGSPTRPMASAARRRIRGSLSFTRAVRSGGGGGGGGGGGSLTFLPV